MQRTYVWLQLALAWLPMWALYSFLIAVVTPDDTPLEAGLYGLRAIGLAAVLGIGVWRLAGRIPWPQPLNARFVLGHLAVGFVYAVLWIALVQMAEALRFFENPLPYLANIPNRGPTMVIGYWLYGTVAGISYAIRAQEDVWHARERATKAEAAAVQAQLSTLRGQLNPHFLFNALHTVVNLIRRDAEKAQSAAEQLASLLRTALDETRQHVTVDQEWDFVNRYVELEQLRFDTRLKVKAEFEPGTSEILVPSFTIQALVENAVRHGAAPRIDPTTITVTTHMEDETLVIRVTDDGAGADPAAVEEADGTGLQGLRQRLAAEYGDNASLAIDTSPDSGFTATVVIPCQRDDVRAEERS